LGVTLARSPSRRLARGVALAARTMDFAMMNVSVTFAAGSNI
jgi:hypothetical protein